MISRLQTWCVCLFVAAFLNGCDHSPTLQQFDQYVNQKFVSQVKQDLERALLTPGADRSEAFVDVAAQRTDIRKTDSDVHGRVYTAWITARYDRIPKEPSIPTRTLTFEYVVDFVPGENGTWNVVAGKDGETDVTKQMQEANRLASR